ncbi:hypothetical protein DY000_02007114 [Brassica cretica]|uniref:Copper transporter n=1 Tax=Brassica cretica TaxID=69181 RepID=A0ABQ7CE17_BRACR|nr:hypothetical protein DY000_02007114 [Brassica cretica]
MVRIAEVGFGVKATVNQKLYSGITLYSRFWSVVDCVVIITLNLGYITGFSIGYILADSICVTHNTRHSRGELVFLQTSYPVGSRKPLIRWIGGRLRRTGSCPMAVYYTMV